MIIGLNTDQSVSRIKGPSRPLQDELSRAEVLASMFFVDAVVLFDEETPFELIDFLKPDILVKGSDYSIDKIVGADVVIANGGRVETMDFIEGYSSTNIINKIINTK
jgi:rfaE bifunctional protein nucleotidyltransferase chain/domain